MVYFSDIFNVDESILESYGAMNISLLNDIPLFIDPFYYTQVKSQNTGNCMKIYWIIFLF